MIALSALEEVETLLVGDLVLSQHIYQVLLHFQHLLR